MKLSRKIRLRSVSRQKGIWMGGHPPLGYDIHNRELVINREEAEQVLYIFRRFAECGSPTQVVRDLRASGIQNKSWTTAPGVHRPGKPIHKAALYRILKNRVYLGEATYKGESFPGRHKPIISQELWDRVHDLIDEHRRNRTTLPRGQTPFPLKGLVRCGHCNMAMRPTHSRKNGQVQYRYYLCINAARAGHDQCQLPSVPAAELERLILDHVRRLIRTPEVIAKILQQEHQNGLIHSDQTIIKQLTGLDPVWEELFPLEQNRLLKPLVESLVVTTTGIDLRLRVDGLGALVDELVNEEERNVA